MEGKDTYMCPICGNTYRERRNVLKHMKEHYEEELHVCNICGDSFKGDEELERHMKTHIIKCPLCEETFTEIQGLQKHLDEKHSETKHFKCSTCDKKFTKKFNFNRHMASHRRLNELKCGKCGKTFTRKDYYDKHTAKCSTKLKTAGNQSTSTSSSAPPAKKGEKCLNQIE